MAAKIDTVFSLLQQSGNFYEKKDYDSLLGALKPLATLVLDAYKTYPDLSAKEHGSQLHEFAKKISEGGVKFVKATRYLVGATAVILVSSYALLQIYHLYNFAKENLRDYEQIVGSLYENELKPTLEYINNRLLSDLDDVDPDDFCEAAAYVTNMLEKLATRLKELRDEIRSEEKSYWRKASNWLSSVLPGLDGGMQFRLETMGADTEKSYDLVVKSRTQIELMIVEMKRTRKRRFKGFKGMLCVCKAA